MKDQNEAQQSNFPGGMGAPAMRALAAAGITNLEQLASFQEANIKKLHGIGPHAMNKLRQAMAEKGLSFTDAGQSKKR